MRGSGEDSKLCFKITIVQAAERGEKLEAEPLDYLLIAWVWVILEMKGVL